MKNKILAVLGALALLSTALAQEKQTWSPTSPSPAPPGPQPPPTVYQAVPAQPAPVPAGQPVYVYDQRVMAQQPVLISPQSARAIVDQFRTNYSKMGSPRILIYVNRELVDERSGLTLSARSEKISTTRNVTNAGASATTNTSTTGTANNTYRNNDKPAPALADRQTVRDVERLMGRPLRNAGATLVDQRVASQLIGDRPLDTITLENDQARKDREAVNSIADVVVEVLIASRSVNVTEISGEKTYTVPDIQATAIRLKDAKMMGQASAADVMNKAGGAAAIARNFGVQDITEATALALMEDMLQEGK